MSSDREILALHGIYHCNFHWIIVMLRVIHILYHYGGQCGVRVTGCHSFYLNLNLSLSLSLTF